MPRGVFGKWDGTIRPDRPPTFNPALTGEAEVDAVTVQFADKPRLAGLIVKEAWRRASRRLRVGPMHRWRFAGKVPERLLVTPPDLRRGDPLVAESIYGGNFYLAGHLMETSGRSPFQALAPSPAFAADLHSFEWLCHLSEAGDALAAQNARSLVGDWLRISAPSIGGVAHDPDVTARRIIAWLMHSPIILGEADHAFYRRFMKSLARQARYLRSVTPEAPDGLPRLRARIALAFASLCMPAGAAQMRVAARHLGEELDRQIFPDGGHISRNPAVLTEILADLLPLRQTYASQNQPAPKGVFCAIDRMLPALRFFRHSDGALALFNGASVSEANLLTTLLRYDESLGDPVTHARQSGYHRLAAGDTVLIADTGLPPAPGLSREAHAGTLAFELSSGGHRIIVNCGAPTRKDADWRRLSRATAAHSTLTLGDRSSSRFSRSDLLERFLGAPLIAGPASVPVRREDDEDGQRFTAAHDGYRHGFGLVHERSLFLTRAGDALEGIDRLFAATAKPPRGPRPELPLAAIRFHLHPSVTLGSRPGGIRLLTRGEAWWFSADVEAEVEDSVFFADHSGARRIFQIVLPFDPLERSEIAWRFEREG